MRNKIKYFVFFLFFVLSGISSAQTKYASLSSQEQTFLTLINEYRAKYGLQPLKVSRTLTSAAKWMSADLSNDDNFSHTDSYGNDPFDRMALFGYNYNTWQGENIAAGNGSADDTFIQWKNSPEHNENMLEPNYRVIGISRVHKPGSVYYYYWTTDFGGYVDDIISTPASTAVKTQ
jgi:uncharacterized protein YkwD